ncbi:MAG: hypothetical protein E2O65_07095 [Gammaproteobacteria bacterium]|nr:MAG: hypothetical protein E2O65_07095 [Gammaproteobacteria bacterium]
MDNPDKLIPINGNEPETRERTLADLADWYAVWFQAQRLRDKSKLPRVSWWVERIGRVPLSEITPELIRETIRELYTTEALHGFPGGQKSLGRHRSSATVNRVEVGINPWDHEILDFFNPGLLPIRNPDRLINKLSS